MKRLSIALAVLALSLSAEAGDLKDVVNDLYGGDGILLQAPPPGSPFPSHPPHFQDSSLAGLGNLSNSLLAGFGFFSFNSPVVGFTLDLETGEPSRATESLGPLLTERATTLGQGKLNIGFSVTRIKYTHFEGRPLGDLQVELTHEDVTEDGRLGPPPFFAEFELDTIQIALDLTLEQEFYTFFATYGATPRSPPGTRIALTTPSGFASAS